MNTEQSFFEVWNYFFLFMTISTLVAFTVDMFGHKTKTISSNVFSLTVFLGVILGEMSISFLPISNFDLKITLTILIIVFLSTAMPLKFRTIDPVVRRSALRKNHKMANGIINE